MRWKQDRSAKSGHRHTWNTQDSRYAVKQYPPAYHDATNAERWRWRQAKRLRNMAALLHDDHELERQAKKLLLQAAADYEVRSGIE